MINAFSAFKETNSEDGIKYNNQNPSSRAERVFLPKIFPRQGIRKPLSDDVELDYTLIDPEAMKRVEKTDFYQHCDKIVDKSTYWGFGKEVSLDKRLSYQKKINHAILKLPSRMNHMAVKNFKRVIYITHQRLSEQASINLTKRIIKMATKNSAELRDEFYLQMIKQTRSNTKQEVIYQTWTLMAVISCYITPSKQSSFAILNFLKNTSEKSHDEEIKQWAKFIFKRIIVGYYTEGRKVLPCTSEIKNIKERKKLITKIRLFSGGYVDVFFENYETVKDISDQTCQKLGIPKEHWSRYGCFEITIKDNCIEEAFVEEYNKMADVVASWEHEEDFYLAKLGKKINVRFELYFKMRFYYPLNKELELDRLLLYNEACYYFKFGHCQMTYKELCSLTALHLQIAFGDYTIKKYGFFRNKLFSQVPNFKAKYEKRDIEFLSDVLNQYRSLEGLDREKSRLRFLEAISIKDAFYFDIYEAKLLSISSELTIPDNLYVGLGVSTLRIFDVNYHKIGEIKYDRMWKWGFSDSNFSFIFGKSKKGDENEKDKLQKVVIETFMGICMSYTMQCYAELLLGISPTSNKLTYSNTTKNIIGAKNFFKRVNIFEKFENPHIDSDDEDVEENEAKEDQQ